MESKYKVLILGGGSGGISVAARLRRFLSDSIGEDQIAIVEPSDKHYYQPLWTLVGAGQADKYSSERQMKDMIPPGVAWIREKVLEIHPEQNSVTLADQTKLTYEYLVVATGLKLDWDKLQGLNGHLGKNGIHTVYEFNQADATFEAINNFKGGVAIFVMPPVPIKCAGAPQKIMYMADRIFRNNGVRHKTKIIFATAGKAMFGMQPFADALTKVAKERDIEPHFLHKIIGVDAERKEAIFSVTAADGSVSEQRLKFDFLHLVPTMSAHSFIANSPLAHQEGDQKGWLAVDKFTLRHLRYPNIFGVGDVTGVPNSKTGAAIRKQYPVVVNNLISVMRGEEPKDQYDGYASCPLITDIGKVMLFEFGYDGKLMPTFPLDPTVPRRSYWHLKKNLLPILYWYGMMKGRA